MVRVTLEALLVVMDMVTHFARGEARRQWGTNASGQR